MITLLIIRHAVAMERAEFQAQYADVTGGEAIADEGRPLTDDGVRKMRRAARGYKKLVDRPELLITSPLKRAVQTAEILSEVWRGLEPEVCQALSPGSDRSEFFDWLRNHPRWPTLETRDVVLVVVGHEPDLSQLVNELISDRGEQKMQLKKGGGCLVEISSDLESGHGQLEWLMPPRLIRKFAD